ncbi:hypothetical protein LOTGIDRAFT_179569 [Lottia gigantea]|uniref:Hexosyltransferase n=1 Tax=Lottia gigantea TaxID=225164 RepID=V3Z2M5_LOTGI|nr:hypothetical protein LOTGIDRAFT_179569 [Lottia gigantea]ESO84833.1 hypothetical protein LOTGIDRAFT_179569 [Lottia gigantea]
MVGIMTAKKFIDSRGLSAFRTWYSTIKGRVNFFSSEGSTSDYGVPVIALQGVDDSYPPQKKSFLMLKYMHDHFIDDYEWFVRADDDVFIKGDKLEQFLRRINSSRPYFIGQTGIGKKEELGMLAMTEADNFCMGGPGIIFSRETLRRMAPHIGYCLNNLYTTHEDVEVGRCVQKFGGTQCTWSYEMRDILYQNYQEYHGSYKESLKKPEVENAVTLHPVKEPVYLFRVHSYFMSTKVMRLRQKMINLNNEIDMVESAIAKRDDKSTVSSRWEKYKPYSVSEVISWDYITRSVFSPSHNNPQHGIEKSAVAAFTDMKQQILLDLNKDKKTSGITKEIKDMLQCYRKIDPQYGSNYVMDLKIMTRKPKARAVTAPQRFSFQQTFSEILLMEENLENSIENISFSSKIVKLFQTLSFSKPVNKRTEKIHFIMPLAGRLKIFERFMRNFELVGLQSDQNVTLHVVLFHSERENVESDIIRVIHSYQAKYGNKVELIQARGPFSRGRGIELGASRCHNSALLYFVDVDIIMTQGSLRRIRMNTIQNSQAYFPIVFSQYDPVTVCLNDTPYCTCEDGKCHIDSYVVEEDAGYWRQFGFGIASMYRSDMVSVGGFDLTIEGWGKEDVDLYQKYLESNLTIFRAVDPGMTHVYHEIYCDSNLERSQLIMCNNTKSKSYGGMQFVSNFVYSTKSLYDRTEQFLLNVNK